MKNKVVLIQGAMDIEIEYLKSKLQNLKKKNISMYEFYEGNINNTNIVISKTLIGTINATIATMIGIQEFNPDLIINQGIAGSHRRNIHIGDIVVGKNCYNINAYSMPAKKEKEGSNPFEWEINKRAKEIKYADEKIVEEISEFLKNNSSSNIYVGTLGSGDVFNREIDRIDWITRIFENLCEDMESIGMYSVCEKFDIPCIGIRIISNNEITGEKLDEQQVIKLQQLLIEFIRKLDVSESKDFDVHM